MLGAERRAASDERRGLGAIVVVVVGAVLQLGPNRAPRSALRSRASGAACATCAPAARWRWRARRFRCASVAELGPGCLGRVISDGITPRYLRCSGHLPSLEGRPLFLAGRECARVAPRRAMIGERRPRANGRRKGRREGGLQVGQVGQRRPSKIDLGLVCGPAAVH